MHALNKVSSAARAAHGPALPLARRAAPPAAPRPSSSSSSFRSPPSPPPSPPPPRLLRAPAPPPRGLGDSAVGGFLDVAKLVSGSKGVRSPYEDLAADIGRDVYADVGGWHLFLRDLAVEPGAEAKMSAALAAELGPCAADRPSEAQVEAVLARVPVRLGGGRGTVPLLDLVPKAGVRDLARLVEEFGRRR